MQHCGLPSVQPLTWHVHTLIIFVNPEGEFYDPLILNLAEELCELGWKRFILVNKMVGTNV